MYKSTEIRWFVKDDLPAIARWFAGRGMSFAATRSRTDFYLSLPGKNDLGIKLREGNIEIKQRLGDPVLHKLYPGAVGQLENWIRWGFGVKDDDAQATNILHVKSNSWIEVYKERMGVKITRLADGGYNIVDIKDQVPFGCQVEYTRLAIDGGEWFTFALEWFGDQKLEPEDELLQEILNDTRLGKDHSMGYNEFLNGLKSLI